MASVNPQSIEELDSRIVYKFPATRFEQAAVTLQNTWTTGLKTLVNQNSGGTTSLVVPASNNKAKFFTIELEIKVAFVYVNTALAGSLNVVVESNFLRAEFPSSGLLQIDGKPTQSKFYSPKTVILYNSAYLRAIGYANIEIEPMIPTANIVHNSVMQFDFTSANAQIISLLYPVVTFYK